MPLVLFLITDLRVASFGPATRSNKKGQRRLNSSDRKSEIGNRNSVAHRLTLHDLKIQNSGVLK
jgi:hypothetical protein